MALPDIFSEPVTAAIAERINKLTVDSKPLWGKMNVSQMLAHCNVSYEMTYENIHPKPNPFMKLILKGFIKKVVVNEKPYVHNSRTAPAFLITTEKEFNKEKERLLAYIKKTQSLGAGAFEGKENNSFGKMTATEWNNMFYKHLDHHLRQFGV